MHAGKYITYVVVSDYSDLFIYQVCSGSVVETEGPRVPASLASLRCVLEQDTLILA